MKADALLQTMRAQRMSWVDLEPGKRVQIIRPREAEIRELVRPDGAGITLGVELPEVKRFTVGWEGIKESDLIGSAGASDPVPFDAALWDEMVSDRSDWANKVAKKLMELIEAHIVAKEAATKNSTPSSTQPTA